MKFIQIILLIAFLINGVPGFSQEQKKSNEYFVKTGSGFFTDRFRINGSVLYTELGIKQSNNYTFSVRYSLSEIQNLLGSFPEIKNYHPIYVTKLVTVFMGYDVAGKNGKHHFYPQLGFGRAYSRHDYPGINDADGSVVMYSSSEPDTGPQMNLNYHFQLTPGCAVGVEASGFLGIEMGIMLYYSFTPYLIVKF
jgi:hypothetical protein